MPDVTFLRPTSRTMPRAVATRAVNRAIPRAEAARAVNRTIPRAEATRSVGRTISRTEAARAEAARSVSRRHVLRSTLAGCALLPAAKGTASGAVFGAAPGPAAHGRGASAQAPIVLGVSAAFSGSSRGLGIELYRGASAYFEHVNQRGGVGGRRIDLKLYDDGYQPDPSVQNTRTLMLEDRVFLLFGYVGTPTVTRVLPLLKKFQDDNFYLFFPFTGAQPQREPPYGDFAFNLRASYRQETAGLVNNFVRSGRTRIAVFYQADAYGRSGWEGVKRALERHGYDLAGEATYRRGAQFTASMRSQVEILQQGDPQAVICVGSYNACAAFARDAVDLGLRAPMANLSFVGSENLLGRLTGLPDSGRYTSLLVNSQVVPSYHDSSIPAVQEYHDMMDRYDPQPPEQLVTEAYEPVSRSFVSLEGFLNAKLMVEILGRLGGNPQRVDLERAVFSVRDFDLGIGETVSFGPARRQGLQRVYYTKVEDDRFVTLEDDDWASLGATDASA